MAAEKLNFISDYSQGCLEVILKRLTDTNLVPVTSYGEDIYSGSAKEKIRQACRCPEAEIVFLAGGTQTNQFAIDVMARPYEGVLCVRSAHINEHEAGAIEMTGRKVLTLPTHDGLMDPDELKAYMESFINDPVRSHIVPPGMVYLTQPTELGTLYDRKTLDRIRGICDDYGLKLYVDGARLIYGLASEECGIDLPYLARTADAFYIGGTKAGLLIGEALVFPKNNAPRDLMTQIKRHGALLSKGRLIGLSFDTLFTDDLYRKVGERAVGLARMLKKELAARGVELYSDSPTNQQFFVVTNERAAELEKKVSFNIMMRVDEDHSVIRFCTSWATTHDEVEALVKLF